MAAEAVSNSPRGSMAEVVIHVEVELNDNIEKVTAFFEVFKEAHRREQPEDRTTDEELLHLFWEGMAVSAQALEFEEEGLEESSSPEEKSPEESPSPEASPLSRGRRDAVMAVHRTGRRNAAMAVHRAGRRDAVMAVPRTGRRDALLEKPEHFAVAPKRRDVTVEKPAKYLTPNDFLVAKEEPTVSKVILEAGKFFLRDMAFTFQYMLGGSASDYQRFQVRSLVEHHKALYGKIRLDQFLPKEE